MLNWKRMLSFVAVGFILFVATKVLTPTDEEEAVAYRDWMVQKGAVTNDQLADLSRVTESPDQSDLPLEALEDTDLFPEEPDSQLREDFVLHSGEQYLLTAPLKLRAEITQTRGDISLVGREFDSMISTRSLRNEWHDAGVRVTVQWGRVEAYLFNIWVLETRGQKKAIRVLKPDLNLEETGRLTRQELSSMKASGKVFNCADSYDPDFDFTRGKGLGYRTEARLTIDIPANLDLSPGAGNRTGLIRLSSSHGGEYAFQLIHTHGSEGLVLQQVDD